MAEVPRGHQQYLSAPTMQQLLPVASQPQPCPISNRKQSHTHSVGWDLRIDDMAPSQTIYAATNRDMWVMRCIKLYLSNNLFFRPEAVFSLGLS